MTNLLAELIDDAERHVSRVLVDEKAGQLVPLCVMRGRDGETILCPVPWRSGEEKALMLAVLRYKMRREGVHAYCLMSEAWAALQPEGWKPGDQEGQAPSERPDRKEIVVALACDKKNTLQRQWRIVRGEAGTIVKLVRETSELTSLGGRMAELLR